MVYLVDSSFDWASSNIINNFFAYKSDVYCKKILTIKVVYYFPLDIFWLTNIKGSITFMNNFFFKTNFQRDALYFENIPDRMLVQGLFFVDIYCLSKNLRFNINNVL